MLALGNGFGVSSNDKFRDQRVMVEIKIPVGRQIRFDNSVGEKLNPYEIRVAQNDRNGRRRNWNRRDWDYEWHNNSFYNWAPDTDYYMTADGKLKEVGIPEIETPSTPKEIKKDSIRREMQRKLDSVETTGSEQTDVKREEEETTQKRDIGGELPTPMPVPFVPTIF